MNFSFSERELAFAAEARAWLAANLPAEWRRDHCWTRSDDPMWKQIARQWQRTLYDGGWIAIRDAVKRKLPKGVPTPGAFTGGHKDAPAEAAPATEGAA